MIIRVTSILACFACALSAQADGPIASDRGLDGFISVDRLPKPDDPILQSGRLVWGDSCSNCHGGNKATGAPKITSTRAWATRIDKGMGVLVEHALNGFVGPKYTQMPARGANPDLKDAEVAAAVAFMVWASGGAEEALAFTTKQKGMGQ